MIKTNLYLTIPQMAKLEAIKQETGIAYAETIRRALDAYLKGLPQAVVPKQSSAKRRGRPPK